MRFGKKPVESRQRPGSSRSSAPVYSYYNAPSPSRPNQEKAIDMSAASTSRIRLMPTIIALVVILLSILFSLTLSPKPYLVTSDGMNSPYRPHHEYEDEAAEILGSSMGNRTKLTIRTAEVERHILDKFPELRAASMRLPILGRRLNLIVEVRQPQILLTTPGKSFVLDESGRAVTELQDLHPDARPGLIVVKDQGGLAVEIGKQAITTETVSFIKAVKAQLEAQNLNIEELTLPLAANQLDIRLNGLQYYIKMDVSGDARLQVGSFLAVRDRLSREGVTPKEYVDVRVEEKVFYK